MCPSGVHYRWSRDLRRVRGVLPDHLQRAELPSQACFGSWVIKALADGTTVGFVWVVPAVGMPGPVYIEEVAVLVGYQGSGIGTRLVKEAVRRLGELGYDAVTVHLLRSARWVECLGFRDVGYGFRDVGYGPLGLATSRRHRTGPPVGAPHLAGLLTRTGRHAVISRGHALIAQAANVFCRSSMVNGAKTEPFNRALLSPLNRPRRVVAVGYVRE
jgi:GNAT superfamily N-acetyltransferase